VPTGLTPLRLLARTGEAYRVVWSDHYGEDWWVYSVALKEDAGHLTAIFVSTGKGVTKSKSITIDRRSADRIRSVIAANGFWDSRQELPPSDDSFQAMWVYLAVEGCREDRCSCFDGLEASRLSAYSPLFGELRNLLAPLGVDSP
jgi:hypothetical protein